MKVLQESIPVYKVIFFVPLSFFFFSRGQKKMGRALSSVLVEVLLIAFKTSWLYVSCSRCRQRCYHISQITTTCTALHVKYWSCSAAG